MPERDHEPAPQRGDRLGRGYDCFGIAQSFAQCPASRFVPHGAMFQLAVLSDHRPLAKCLDTITVDDLEQHTRQPPTDGAHPLLKPDQVLLVAAGERIAKDCGGGGYPQDPKGTTLNSSHNCPSPKPLF